MKLFNGVEVPSEGETITFKDGKLGVPANPIIPFIEGDGTGRDIWKASRRVFDAAVEKTFGGKRKIVWYEILPASGGRQSKLKLPSGPRSGVDPSRSSRFQPRAPTSPGLSRSNTHSTAISCEPSSGSCARVASSWVMPS